MCICIYIYVVIVIVVLGFGYIRSALNIYLVCVPHIDIKSTRMSHRPLYPYIVVGLCVYRMVKHASPSADIERKKKTEESPPPPVRIERRCRHLGNLTSPGTKMARVPYCNDVTVGVSSCSGLASLLRRTAERWQEMPVSLE